MSIRKPPVSSSIGIEIKAPVGIELEGDTVVKAPVEEDIWEYGVHLHFVDTTDSYESFKSKEAAIGFARDVAIHGYLKSIDGKPGRYKYHMPVSVLSADIIIEEEEEY